MDRGYRGDGNAGTTRGAAGPSSAPSSQGRESRRTSQTTRHRAAARFRVDARGNFLGLLTFLRFSADLQPSRPRNEGVRLLHNLQQENGPLSLARSGLLAIAAPAARTRYHGHRCRPAERSAVRFVGCGSRAREDESVHALLAIGARTISWPTKRRLLCMATGSVRDSLASLSPTGHPARDRPTRATGADRGFPLCPVTRRIDPFDALLSLETLSALTELGRDPFRRCPVSRSVAADSTFAHTPRAAEGRACRACRVQLVSLSGNGDRFSVCQRCPPRPRRLSFLPFASGSLARLTD